MACELNPEPLKCNRLIRQIAPDRAAVHRQPLFINKQARGAGGPGYDGVGNLNAVGSATFTYDAENRLVAATERTDPTMTYTYDSENQQIMAWPCFPMEWSVSVSLPRSTGTLRKASVFGTRDAMGTTNNLLV